MSKIVLNDVTNLNALSVINDNFDKLEQELQNKVLYRDNPVGEPNTLNNDVDANGHNLYNVQDLTIDGGFTVAGQDVGAYIGQAAVAADDAAASALAAANSAASAGASAITANADALSADADATAAAASAVSAASSASTATTQAGIAITGGTTATTQAGIATTKASEASTSASSAATSATTATTQAGIATTGATTATAQASNAAASATSAANSAAAAAASYDSFDDRYLGTKTSDPTLDNDGNALVVGALYYNTTTQVMKVYDGANWIAATSAGAASMSVYKFVATAGQTTFSGAATVGGTLSYTSGNIIVFLNGSSLDSTDYTATNGTSVVLSVAASLNDEVVIVAFKSFTVADTYTQSAADAKFLNKTNITASKVLGRDTSGAGVVQELPIAVDAAGNTGLLGATPSAWNSSWKGVDLLNGHALAVNAQTNFRVSNAYYDASSLWKYKSTGAASVDYIDSLGNYAFFAAASGSAGAQVNFNTQFACDADGSFKFNSGYGSAAKAFGCRAWVNFNGTGTVAIRASGNVSSITDNGTGRYTINLSTALPDTNYSVVGYARNIFDDNIPRIFSSRASDTKTTTAFSVVTGPNNQAEDCPEINALFFR